MLEAVEQTAIVEPIVLKKTGQYKIVLDNVSGKIYAQIERGAYWRLKNPQVTPVAPPASNCIGFTPSPKFISDLAGKVIEALCSKSPELASFVLSSSAMMNMAAAVRAARTLETYSYWIKRYSEWAGLSPDQLIEEARSEDVNKRIHWFITETRSSGMSDGTILNVYKALKCFYHANFIDGVKLLPVVRKNIRRAPTYNDRPPTQEELQRLLEVADLQGKVIITFMALGGFRPSTLVRLKYRHVKEDLERGIIPIHVHVEAQITKGQYSDYDTFLAKEAVDALNDYLSMRRMGTRKIPPEEIVDESPIVRNERLAASYIKRGLIPPGITTDRLRDIVHELYRKAGLLNGGGKRRYELRAHSLRKFFKTQLEAKGVKTIYVEYMMGHVRSPYDKTVEMKGVEFLRKIYAAADLRITPRPAPDDQFFALLEDFIRSKGFDVDKELLKKAIVKPHRTIVTSEEMEKERRKLIRDTFIKLLKNEFFEGADEYIGSK